MRAVSTLALLAGIALAAGAAVAAEKSSIGKGEGQVDIVAWPGYIERGETDKAYDWVTGFVRVAATRPAARAR